MISKIIGLVLIAPLLAFVLTTHLYASKKKERYEMTMQETYESYWGYLALVLLVEAFGFGLYLLLK